MKHFLAFVTMLVLGYGWTYAQGKFGLDDLYKLHTITDPQISPDGKSVVVVVASPDTAANKNPTAIYLVEIPTGTIRQLTFDRSVATHPRWSSRGDNIAFISDDAAGRKQIYILPVNGGEAKRLTNSTTGVQHFTWNPDGTAIAFVQQDEPANKKELARGYDAFEVKHNNMFSKATPVPSHIWLISSSGEQARRLTSGSWSVATGDRPLSWSADGKRLAFQSNESPDYSEIVFTVKTLDVGNGNLKRITTAHVGNGQLHRERNAAFSPDGNHIAYLFHRENVAYGSDVYITPSGGGDGENFTGKLDRMFFRAEWSADSKAVLFAADDYNKVSLWLQPLNGNIKKIKLDNLCITGRYWYHFNAGRNNSIVFVASSPERPEELYYLANPDATPLKLTRFNDQASKIKFGKQETFSWKSDEFNPNGILTYPPDFDPQKKYPLVLEIHGGPRSASNEWFGASVQLKAARDYIVFQPNFRGSDNMGYKFSEAINGDMCEGPGNDIMRGIAELKKRPYIDTTKIAVTGWSYGGLLTTWLIGNYQGWKCAVAGAATTNFLDEYAQSEIGRTDKFELGGVKSPYSVSEKSTKQNWIKQSPITYAENVRTPTLLLSNASDVIVPVSQVYNYFRVLQDIGTESKFIVFPIEGHIPTDPARYKQMNRFILEWLDKYLRP